MEGELTLRIQNAPKLLLGELQLSPDPQLVDRGLIPPHLQEPYTGSGLSARRRAHITSPPPHVDFVPTPVTLTYHDCTRTKWPKLNNSNTMLRLVSLSITAGPLYKVTQTVQLSGNETLNRKVLSSRRKVR